MVSVLLYTSGTSKILFRYCGTDFRGRTLAAEAPDQDERLVAGETASVLGRAKDSSIDFSGMAASDPAAGQNSLAS